MASLLCAFDNNPLLGMVSIMKEQIVVKELSVSVAYGIMRCRIAPSRSIPNLWLREEAIRLSTVG
jgi:hypothetical protein